MQSELLLGDVNQALRQCFGTERGEIAVVGLIKGSRNGNVVLLIRVNYFTTEQPEIWVAKLCRGTVPYEITILDTLSDLGKRDLFPRTIAAAPSPAGWGHWIFSERGAPMSASYAEANLKTLFDKLQSIHGLTAGEFERRLPSRFGRMGRRQWERQFHSNLNLIHGASRRLDIAADIDSVWRNIVSMMGEMRELFPISVVHGDACLDNWLLDKDSPCLIDWELARVEDPVTDFQALTLFLSPAVAFSLSADYLNASVYHGHPKAPSILDRFWVARSEYCLRLSAWYLQQAVQYPGHFESTARFSGALAKTAPILLLARRALQELSRSRYLREAISH